MPHRPDYRCARERSSMEHQRDRERAKGAASVKFSLFAQATELYGLFEPAVNNDILFSGCGDGFAAGSMFLLFSVSRDRFGDRAAHSSRGGTNSDPARDSLDYNQ